MENKQPVRKIAFKILNEYFSEKSYINLLLKSGLPSNLDVRNRGFITEVVYGVVRNKRFLDNKISKYSKTKINKISVPVLNILRMGFYQIYFMDKVPEFAIINESVKLAEKFTYKSKGFVNAILRNGINKVEEVLPPQIKYSFSDEMYQLILNQYGDKTLEILENLNKKKPTVLRANKLKTTVNDILEKLENYEIINDYILINGNFSIDDLFNKGYYSIQSISSQMAVRALSPCKNDKILDSCSAPGGKTAYIGELLENTGEIVACDIHKHRCDLVTKNLERCGITNCEVKNLDATKISDEYIDYFDKILADVPCSGLGVIGGKPDIKWQDLDYSSLVSLQENILKSVSKALKVGGTLVYSTCTINKDENINQINKFLEKNKNFKLKSFKIDNISYNDGFIQILPSENTIGFFIAKLIREDV